MPDGADNGHPVMGADLGSLCRAVKLLGCKLYLDVSPLMEEHWTGIPVVAAGLARTLLAWLPEHAEFFHDHHVVNRDALEDALVRGSGLYLRRDFERGEGQAGPLSLLDAGALAAGIYPSVKRVSQIFPIECSIVHDISTLITPQFHTATNIRYHMRPMVDDLTTNTLTFGVSEATVEDVKAYLGAPPDRVHVAYNGVTWPWWFEVQAANEIDPREVEPYFLILGTREPRKNIMRVIELLMLFPELLDHYRFVIAGKMGWLEDQQAIPPVLNQAIRRGRIQFPGYVSEYEKYKLLRAAEASIYPSYFEGFGLPVLESLSVGTPCIASFSSSIPEVGGDACIYFDPFSAESLYSAVRLVQESRPKQSPDFQAACARVSARFTWDNMLGQILHRLMPEMEALAEATSGRTAPSLRVRAGTA